MTKEIYSRLLLTKYQQLHSRYQDLIKLHQSYLYITIFTSAAFLFFAQYIFKIDMPRQFVILGLVPAYPLCFLWIQFFAFSNPFRMKYEPRNEYTHMEYLQLLGDVRDEDLRKLLSEEFEFLDTATMILARSIKRLQMTLTITWIFFVVSATIPFFLRLMRF